MCGHPGVTGYGGGKISACCLVGCVVVASHGNDDAQNSAFLYLWILAEVVRSCYTLTWDIKMDWGLLDRSAGDNRLLREEIVYPRKVCMPRSRLYNTNQN